MKLKFIEIGTSNFDTMAHLLANGSIKLSDDERAMSIEPMSEYLNQLPDNKKLIKLCCAIVTDPDKKKEKFFYVSPKTIAQQGFPNAKSLRGSNSVGKPHILHTHYMSKHNDYFGSDIEDLGQFKTRNLVEEGLVTIEEVDCLTWTSLIDNYSIDYVEHVKLDVEGMDIDVVEMILEYYQDNPNKKSPKFIDFEVNKTVAIERRTGVLWKQFIDFTVECGYKLEKIGPADYRLSR